VDVERNSSADAAVPGFLDASPWLVALHVSAWMTDAVSATSECLFRTDCPDRFVMRMLGYGAASGCDITSILKHVQEIYWTSMLFWSDQNTEAALSEIRRAFAARMSSLRLTIPRMRGHDRTPASTREHSRMNDSALPAARTDRGAVLSLPLMTDTLLLTAIWCAATTVVNPLGDFPLNDDWSYGLTVKHLLETGDYRPQEWALVPLVSHALWGLLFCLPDGFSFTALRFASLAAAWLGVLGCYVLVRDLQQPRRIALLVAMSLAFNPVYYVLANSFMTDAPFTAACIWSAVFFVRDLRTGSDTPLLAATGLVVVATLSRELALCIPLAYAIASFTIRRQTRDILRSLAPLTAAAAIFVAFRYWLMSTGRMPTLVDGKMLELLQAFQGVGHFAQLVLDNVFVVMAYLGLFLLPVLLALWKRDPLRLDRTGAFLSAAGLVLFVIAGWVHATLGGAFGTTLVMPMSANILLKTGTGPLLLRDAAILNLDSVPAPPFTFWLIVSLLAYAGTVLLIMRLVAVARSHTSRKAGGSSSGYSSSGLFLLLCGGLYLAPLLTATYLFDRYLIFLVAFLAGGMLAGSSSMHRTPAEPKAPTLAAFAIAAGFLVFSVAGTHDYLAWNRVRWLALDELAADNVKPTELDGGFEFNGMHLYDPRYKADDGKSPWWVHGDTWLVSFGPVPGYSKVKEYRYAHWLPPHVQTVLVLKKSEML
jgi:hypothetical protein